MDGSEDSLVHCIKPGIMTADTAAVISAETATLLATSIRTSDEEFEDDEIIVNDE